MLLPNLPVSVGKELLHSLHSYGNENFYSHQFTLCSRECPTSHMHFKNAPVFCLYLSYLIKGRITSLNRLL